MRTKRFLAILLGIAMLASMLVATAQEPVTSEVLEDGSSVNRYYDHNGNLYAEFFYDTNGTPYLTKNYEAGVLREYTKLSQEDQKNISEIYTPDDKLTSVVISYSKDEKSVTEYLDGDRQPVKINFSFSNEDGAYVSETYNVNDTLIESYYSKGNSTLYKTFYDDGSPKTENTSLEGEGQTSKEYYESGQLKYESINKENGLYTSTEYAENGILTGEYRSQDGTTLYSMYTHDDGSVSVRTFDPQTNTAINKRTENGVLKDESHWQGDINVYNMYSHDDGSISVWTFNPQTNTEISKYTQPDGRMSQSTTVFDDLDRQISYVRVEANGEQTRTVYEYEGDATDASRKTTYDADNKLISEDTFANGIRQYAMNLWGDGSKHETYYDSEGNSIKTLYTDSDGSVHTTTEIYDEVTGDRLGNETRNEAGDLVGTLTIGADGINTRWSLYRDGSEETTQYDGETGQNITSTSVSSTGFKTTTEYKYDETTGASLGNVTYNEAGDVIGEALYNEEGMPVSEWSTTESGQVYRSTYDDQGREKTWGYTSEGENYLQEYSYDEEGKSTKTIFTRDGALIRTDEYIWEGDKLLERIEYNKLGELAARHVDQYDEEGRRVATIEYNPEGKAVSGDNYDPKTGDYRSYWWLNSQGEVVTSFPSDGRLRIRETQKANGVLQREEIISGEDYRTLSAKTFEDGVQVSSTEYLYDQSEEEPLIILTTDMQGNLIEKTVATVDPATGNMISEVTTNAQGVTTHESFYDEEGRFTGSYQLLAQGYIRTTKNLETLDVTEELYDLNGNLLQRTVRDRDGVILKRDVFEVNKVKRTWYPNNTASTMGIAFRDVKPELTSKWYNFTPVDLSQDGVQRFPLIGGNKFIIGQVELSVKGDEVTVDYTMKGTRYDTARPQSDYFTFFANLDAVTAENLANLEGGYAFGQPISIEKDLAGDTKVLLFVRNVVTFRDHFTQSLQLTRYWPNLKNHKEFRQHLESLMD